MFVFFFLSESMRGSNPVSIKKTSTERGRMEGTRMEEEMLLERKSRDICFKSSYQKEYHQPATSAFATYN